MTGWEDYLNEHQGQALPELQELIQIPSVSAIPEHASDVQLAAEWVAEKLRSVGLEDVEILPTGGHPVVFAQWLHAGDKPTVLLYGHFDVQPIDPLDLWKADPFSGEVSGDRINGRGASDMKGSLTAMIQGLEALLRGEGSLPVNVKLLIEGQEEIGSPQLGKFVRDHRDLLSADLAVSADGAQFRLDQPSIEIGLRGLSALQIDVQGPKNDLHSGAYGGAIHNPIHALVNILDSMRGEKGEVLVEGFYDDVRPLSARDRELIAAVPFNENEYKAAVGVKDLFGEEGYSPFERVWARPTLEINGIYGGFQGEGTKTVLPAQAHAKITCRLVPDQDPDRVFEAIKAHIERSAPRGVEVTVRKLGTGARAYLIPPDQWGNQAAADVLTQLYGKKPVYVRTGGSVPVCEMFLSELGCYTVPFGFGGTDELVHAPNEFWRVSSLERARHAYPLLLQRLASGPDA